MVWNKRVDLAHDLRFGTQQDRAERMGLLSTMLDSDQTSAGRTNEVERKSCDLKLVHEADDGDNQPLSSSSPPADDDDDDDDAGRRRARSAPGNWRSR